MIDGIKTTFVLGAGANIGLDNTGQFPLSSQLAVRIQNQIAAELNEQSQYPMGHIGGAISSSNLGISNDHVTAMRRIENSIVFKDSIDDLVNEWSDLPFFQEVAKVCIAVEILKSESTTQIFAAHQNTVRPSTAMRHLRDSWLGKIFRYANPSCRRRDVRECLNGIRFVTFNYDRCLEASLLTFLHHSQNIPIDECSDIIDSIEIYHAYGSFGRLPELGGDLRFGGTDHREVYRAASRIKTYTEELESGHTAQIRNIVADSDNVIFLGFGFHEQNLKLLFGEGQPTRTKLYSGTSIGMGDNETRLVNRRFSEHSQSISLLPADCHTLVENLKTQIF